jgi:hypothetical protein
MATAVRPCSFYPPPTEDQTRVNPTETLQYEYQIFLQNYKKNPDGLRRQLYTQGSELGRLMSSSSPNCSRTFFYYSLFAIVRVDQSGSIQRIQTCAQNGVNGHPDSASPVDAAIRCYSILVSNLYQSGKGELAEIVCDFLKEDYCTEKRADLQQFLKRKYKILYLILCDGAAYASAPDGIKNEILFELRDGMFLRSVLSMKNVAHPGVAHPGVAQANAILSANGLPPIVYSPQAAADAAAYIASKPFALLYQKEFAQYSGGSSSGGGGSSSGGGGSRRKQKLKSMKSKSKSHKINRKKTHRRRHRRHRDHRDR